MVRKFRGRNRENVFVKTKNYLIITDSDETEANYFKGLKERLKIDDDNVQIDIVNGKKSPDEMIKYAEKASNESSKYREIWMVFDKDDYDGFDDFIDKIESTGYKSAWSNSCFEVWTLSYFKKAPTGNQDQCIKELSKYYKRELCKDYQKNDKEIYNDLQKISTDEEAIKYSNNLYKEICKCCEAYSDMKGTNTVFKLVEELING